ncbi:TIGR04222 domain-containing membrane protein [Nonomuraea turcica]|uniref:TIGR04222 domain-containing membrane protein n=1 Tax=Nonomuraea sp. G32 TaxID=3067274 RepID=UPI00273C575B|nr:TIGR04222 domain-containing membrane protein [Nonomuraea sp. G32]MDP4507714.1 TIGR04222 domain-containing membrane protein [Nonomuraea sp. G32]
MEVYVAETLILVMSAVLAWHMWTTVRSFNAERRRLAVPPHAPGDDEIDELGPYELAYLAGGTQRMLHTALAVLLQSGAIRVSTTGRITAVAGADPPGEPIERAIMDVLSRAGSCSADHLLKIITMRPEPARVRAGLEARGLLTAEGPRRHLERPLNQHLERLRKRIRISLIWALVGCVASLALVIAGVAAWEPRTVLALLIGAASGVIGLLHLPADRYEMRSFPSSQPTERGRRLLVTAQQQHSTPQKKRSKGVAAVTAFGVAVNGLPAGGDPRLLALLAEADGDRSCSSGPRSGSAGDGDSDCSSGGWSSCSSGGGSSCSSGGGSSCSSGGGSSCSSGGGSY